MLEHFQYWSKTLREEDRLETFKCGWKFRSGQCSAINMAKAGWYREPTWDEDEVRCFVCFKELDGWKKDDDPWEEHRKHSPNCMFVRIGKPENELSVKDFLSLQKERLVNQLVSFDFCDQVDLLMHFF
jgi:baculoviral IAP repeat-containing protein 5